MYIYQNSINVLNTDKLLCSVVSIRNRESQNIVDKNMQAVILTIFLSKHKMICYNF